MPAKNQKKIVLAGGGTAGHIEPALAVGRWIQRNYPDCAITFLGTKSGLETQLIPSAGFHLSLIEKAPLPRSLSLSTLLWPIRFVRSIRQAGAELDGASMLIGFGGYVSSSAYLAARLKKVPILVHEANALPGWANSLGLRMGGKGMVGFRSTLAVNALWDSATYVGIPLRSEILHASDLSLPERKDARNRKAKEWNFNAERPIVLVFGGSQGSRHINDVISASKDLIARSGIQVVHAVGKKNDLPDASPGYTPVHYFTDLHEAYIAADLVISRSGAVTCHELAAVNRYSVLVPLPIGNGEQRFNGQMLVEAELATLISDGEFTKEWLSDHLLGLVAQGKKISEGVPHPRVPLNAVDLIGELIKRELGEGV